MSRQEKIDHFRHRLRDSFLIKDGAMGTLLSAEGREAGRSLELLNVEEPERVQAAHRAYVEAGADLIETNTFQGSRPALDGHGLADRTAELNQAGARLAREAAGEATLVAGSIGPTGRILEPYGEYPESDARDAFAEQAAALAEGGVDLFVVETFSALEEIRLAIAAAAETGLPIVASMAFDPIGRTSFGVTPGQAAEQLAAAGAVAVGANCGTISPLEMVEILAAFKEATSLPLTAQPNAGRPRQTESGVEFPEKPEAMAETAGRFRELGVAIIGGCCGSTPRHIAAIAGRLRRA
jgi:5-methyltetrahydrofolate--homocysteine methyltransferase